MKFKGKTLQEHIWNDMEELGEYAVWDWINVFEHYKVPIKDKNYSGWMKELQQDGTWSQIVAKNKADNPGMKL